MLFIEGGGQPAEITRLPDHGQRGPAAPAMDRRGSGWLNAFVPRVPPDDAILTALRSHIGDAAFEQAQAWGWSAGTKHAVEYALQEA